MLPGPLCQETWVPLACRLVVEYTRLNSCLIRDQAQVFPKREEIRQQLGKECKVWATSNALVAYYQINIDKKDQHKTTFMLPWGGSSSGRVSSGTG